LTITENSQLVGDVTCTVTGAPCITFGAPGIALKLNGLYASIRRFESTRVSKR
jgi:hypothetical protein